MADGNSSGTRNDRSTGELMKQLAQETSTLVRQELDLAKAEMAQKGKQAGLGAGMVGGAGLFGLLAMGTLSACLALVLVEVGLVPWLAALIVTLVWAALAAALALTGKKKVQEAVPPLPEQTVDTLKEDVQWAKSQKPSAKR